MIEPPVVLLPYQQRWIADTATVKVAEKSRRIGLSWAQAAEAALVAGAAQGMHVWYIGYNQEMAREFVADCGFWCRAFSLVASEVEESLMEDDERGIVTYRITLTSGWRITALSSRPTNLRGKQGLVILDEAAFHGELSELLKAALALLIWGGRVSIISTHNGVENPFNELCEDIRAKKKRYSLHRITFDQAIAEGLFRRICLKKGVVWSAEAEAAWRDGIIADYGDSAQEELFCIPKGGSGVFLTRALLGSRTSLDTPVFRMSCAEGLELKSSDERQAFLAAWWKEQEAKLVGRVLPGRMAFGFDFGRTQDLSVLTILQPREGLTWGVQFIVELRRAPYFAQVWLFEQVMALFPGLQAGAMDARGNGQYMAEMARMRWGSRIEAVMLTEGWYREHMPSFKVALEDGQLRELPADEDIITDMRAIQVVKGVGRVPDNTRTRGADGGMRHGDAAISLVLAWAAAQSDDIPIEFMASDEERMVTGLQDY